MASDQGLCPHRPSTTTRTDRVTRKLHWKAGAAVYAPWKLLVEPVFGQIEQAPAFRQFL